VKAKRTKALVARIPVGATLRVESRKCGKSTCKCATDGGEQHGPYHVAFWRDPKTGKTKKAYIGLELPPELAARRARQVERQKRDAAGVLPKTQPFVDRAQARPELAAPLAEAQSAFRDAMETKADASVVARLPPLLEKLGAASGDLVPLPALRAALQKGGTGRELPRVVLDAALLELEKRGRLALKVSKDPTAAKHPELGLYVEGRGLLYFAQPRRAAHSSPPLMERVAQYIARNSDSIERQDDLACRLSAPDGSVVVVKRYGSALQITMWQSPEGVAYSGVRLPRAKAERTLRDIVDGGESRAQETRRARVRVVAAQPWRVRVLRLEDGARQSADRAAYIALSMPGTSIVDRNNVSRLVELEGEHFVVNGVTYKGSSSTMFELWRVTPRSNWAADVFKRDEIAAQMESGARERGNLTGLLVKVKKKEHVLDGARTQVGWGELIADAAARAAAADRRQLGLDLGGDQRAKERARKGPPAPAPTAQRSAQTPPSALVRFAELLEGAIARRVPAEGRFPRGGDKVYAIFAWQAWNAEHDFLELDEFKRRLFEAHQAGSLALSRADLVEAMNGEMVRRSEVRPPWASQDGSLYTGPAFHLIRSPAPATRVAAGSDLEDFARCVLTAARASPTGRWHKTKVFISHVWEEFELPPTFRGRGAMDLNDFKKMLGAAHRAGLLRLGRADLVEAMNPADVKASETPYLNGVFHFVRLDG